MTASGNVIAELRSREFGWQSARVYLNSASFGPLPARSRTAIEDFNRRRWQADLTDPDLVAPQVSARAAAAALIGAHPEEIALSPNTNVGVNIGANAVLRLGDPRRVIVIPDREFPANVYPWLALEREGYRVEIIPSAPNGYPDEDALRARINVGDVVAASVSFVQFSSGYRADVAAIGAACRAHDTLFVIDAIQGLGAVPFAIQSARPDILACGAQKWLCAPWGSGFTYVRRELISKFEPLLPGWLAFQATQDFTQLLDYRYEMLDDARRFETGSLGFQDYVGLSASLDLLLEFGVERIWEHIKSLQAPLIAWAQEHAVEVVSDLRPDHRSGIICIRPPRPDDVHQALAKADVRCAFRENSIRLSPHWFNTLEEMERVIGVLDENVES